MSIDAFDTRRTEIQASFEEVTMSIVSQLEKYYCNQAKQNTASYIWELMSKEVIPFGKANMRYSIHELLERAMRIEEMKYKRCGSNYCSDRDWDGRSLREILATTLEQFVHLSAGLCLNCFKSDGTSK